MKSSDNKASLLDFISRTIYAKKDILIPKEIFLVLGETFSGNDKTIRVSKESASDIKDIRCEEYEEADTRLIARLVYATRLY